MALTIDNMDLEIDTLDIAPSPLAQLSYMMSDVFLPILENPKNQERMPEVVAEDMKRHFHKLVATIAVALSQTKAFLLCF